MNDRDLLKSVLVPISECEPMHHSQQLLIDKLARLYEDGAIDVHDLELFRLCAHQSNSLFHDFVKGVINVCILNINKHYGDPKQNRERHS